MNGTVPTSHPHYRQWWSEQIKDISDLSKKYPPAALPALDPTEKKPMFQQEEQTTEEKPKSDMTQCEYCGAVIKDKKQARAVHLRWCEPYLASKAGGEAAPANGSKPRKNGQPAPAIALDESVTLSPERVSKLWQAVTGGTLAVEMHGKEIVCRVSKSSFDKALPVLLDLL